MSVESSLTAQGIHQFGTLIDPAAATAIHQAARRARDFGPHLFLSEAEYRANPQHWGVNPREGFNFIDQFQPLLGCIEEHPVLVQALTSMLGHGYKVHNKKFVCGIPEAWLPDYLKRIMADSSINNLGAYMRPEFRDITYFHGIDFHQDIIDWPAWKEQKKTHEFLTLYIYIHPVTANDAPLFVMPGSQRFGATRFPHDITRAGEHWRYGDGQGRSMECAHTVLTGDTGYAAIWHSCLIHGTQNIARGTDCRLSLRYIIQRGDDTGELGIDRMNATIDGPLYLDATRTDLNEEGKVTVLNNTIRTVKD